MAKDSKSEKEAKQTLREYGFDLHLLAMAKRHARTIIRKNSNVPRSCFGPLALGLYFLFKEDQV